MKHWHRIKQSLPGGGRVDDDGAGEVLTVLATGDRADQTLLGEALTPYQTVAARWRPC